MLQQQTTVVLTTSAPQSSSPSTKHLSKIRMLGVAEVLLGSLCFIFGAAIAGETVANVTSLIQERVFSQLRQNVFNFNNRNSLPFRTPIFTAGEGIWCGIWVIVAGAIGICAGKSNSTSCLIKAHLGFSIVAAIFSFVLMIIAAVSAAIASDVVGSVLALNSIVSVIGFLTFILHIISSGFCCATLQCCCRSQNQTNSGGYGGRPGKVVLAQPPPQQAGAVELSQQPTEVQYQNYNELFHERK